MRILNVAYPFAPVSLDSAGGAEQILALIDRALCAAGHTSLVLACAGSRVEGELIPVATPAGIIDDAISRRVREMWRTEIRRAVLRGVDLIHMHGIDFPEYLPPDGPPVLVTLHLPPTFYPAGVFRLTRPFTSLVCVSRSQRNACPESSRVMEEIENGVPLDLIDRRRPATVSDGDAGYAFALGRICPEKGFHLAVDAARLAGVPLHLAGEVYAYQSHLEYFRERLEPLLRPPHQFLGSVTFRQKIPIMAAARCLLVPSLVAETSSLVAMEAMACGTPVIAFPAGALPEIVDHGRTGFLVRDVAEMAEAIRKSDEIDRGVCRRVARERFSAGRMVNRYLELYDRLRQPQTGRESVGATEVADGGSVRHA